MITKNQLPLVGAMSVKEFAKWAGISRSSAYLLIRDGQLRARKVFSRTIIAVIDAEEWLARQPLISSKV